MDKVPTMNLRDIIDYIKLEHTVFDLPFIFSGAVLASAGKYDAFKFILILLAGTFARATGMSINRIEGRKFDLINPRKKEWALVRGTIPISKAVILTIVFGAVFEVSSFLLNRLVLYLSPIVLVLFIADPYLKKITPWRHFFMGLTIGVGVLGGYLAINPVFPVTPELYLIFLGSSLWIAGFDMIYVIPDIETDRRNGLKTVMTRYGIDNGLKISVLVHAVTFLSFLILSFYLRTIFYYVCLIPIFILIVYQHIIIDPSNPRTIRASFLGANSFIGIIFLAGMVLSFPY